jgi:hypothetical protein
MINAGLQFDTLLLLGHNFGLMESKDKAKKILSRLFSIMPAGCRIIAETMDPHTTNNPVHLVYHKKNIARSRMPGQINIRVRFKNFTGPWFDYLFVSLKELKSIISGTGWKIEKVFKDKSPTYIVILLKS